MALRMLPVARPCTESFDAMPGDARTRFCDRCGKHVHDLSAGTEAQARTLYREARGERLCVRFAKDSSGAVRFLSTSLAVAMSLAGCSGAMPERPVTPVEVDRDMGDTIPDTLDRCPDDGTSDGADGCPSPGDAGVDGK